MGVCDRCCFPLSGWERRALPYRKRDNKPWRLGFVYYMCVRVRSLERYLDQERYLEHSVFLGVFGEEGRKKEISHSAASAV